MSYNETLERQYLRSIPQQGKVEWIGIRPKRLLEVHSVSEVQANPDTGLEGDHFKKSSTGKRQVTLIQQEHLDVVARILGKTEIPPELLRRNIVVSGINLLALKHLTPEATPFSVLFEFLNRTALRRHLRQYQLLNPLKIFAEAQKRWAQTNGLIFPCLHPR